MDEIEARKVIMYVQVVPEAAHMRRELIDSMYGTQSSCITHNKYQSNESQTEKTAIKLAELDKFLDPVIDAAKGISDGKYSFLEKLLRTLNLKNGKAHFIAVLTNYDEMNLNSNLSLFDRDIIKFFNELSRKLQAL